MKPNDFKLGDIKCSTHTISQELEEIRLLLKNKSLQPRTLLTINAHIYNTAYSDSTLRKIFNSARLVTADGMSILWASQLLKKTIPERCNATEAFRAFLLAPDMPKSTGILIGCAEDEAIKAATNMENFSTHCRIKKTYSGYRNVENYKQIFSSLKNIDFIFLGMGTPKTEKIAKLANEINPQAIVWHIGGGTIKIFAGTMKEAPIFWRRSGLQWLHRLISTPLSLWRRYLIGNPLFIYRILKLGFIS